MLLIKLLQCTKKLRSKKDEEKEEEEEVEEKKQEKEAEDGQEEGWEGEWDGEEEEDEEEEEAIDEEGQEEDGKEAELEGEDDEASDAAVQKPAKEIKYVSAANAKLSIKALYEADIPKSTAHESAHAKLRASKKVIDRDAADIAKLEKDPKEVSPAANVDSTDTAKDAAVDAATVMHLVEDAVEIVSDSTRAEKIMRQIAAPPAETMKPMIKVFKEMIAKLEKLNKHDGDENRMIFCEQIAKDLESCEAPFKDHKGITYKEHSASECLGVRGPMDVEITSDSADECQAKCNDLGPDCAGFLHATSGLDAGKCLFKKGGIKDVKTSDKSTCFEKEDPRDPLVKKFVALNLWVLEQASKEINWICQAGFRSTREENRVEAFRRVVKTYTDGLQCQPGDIPCPGGKLTGQKPMCKCVGGKPPPPPRECVITDKKPREWCVSYSKKTNVRRKSNKRGHMMWKAEKKKRQEAQKKMKEAGKTKKEIRKWRRENRRTLTKQKWIVDECKEFCKTTGAFKFTVTIGGHCRCCKKDTKWKKTRGHPLREHVFRVATYEVENCKALAVADSCEVTGKCECIPCGTATPKAFPSGTCAPKTDTCSAKSPANPGCYTNCVRGCDCAKRAPVPQRCDCIPCGTATPKAFPSGVCAPASGTCSAAAAGPGCYTKGEANCDCASRTYSPN